MAKSKETNYEIKSPLPDVAFELWKMHAREELGRPFEYQLDVFSKESDVSAEKMLGESMTLSVKLSDGKTRYFNGLVSRFAHHNRASGYSHYRITLRPWFWFLQRTADCQIFQELDTKQILTKLFKDQNSFSDFKFSLSKTYTKREYCVQYRESDFDFASRLLEQEGIYYFFEHDAGKHIMVLTDSYSGHKPIEGGAEIPFRLPSEAVTELEYLYQWLTYRQLQTGSYVMDDFDFTKPKANLEIKSLVKRKHTNDAFEVFDYPGQYTETSVGQPFVKTRLGAEQARFQWVEAQGNDVGLTAGGLFSLIEFPREDQNAEYLIISTEIKIESGQVRQVVDSDNLFDAKIIAIPSQQAYATPQTTPKPMVRGPQTAIVVGKKGEEIYTDEYGRIKVQFHWDRVGKSDENSSCWVRVAQIWAGKTWGAIHIPRLGQEVIVDFLEGDPDRPIVTGRVYNADQMPPYKLPDNKTQSGVKSRSTKKGDAKTFNELRFEDKKSEEEIYFHAEKNFTRIVENDDVLEVGLEKKDKGDQTIKIHNNQEVTVGNSKANDGSQKVTVWKDRTHTVEKGDDTLSVKTGSRQTTIQKDDDTTIKTGDQTIKISAGAGLIQAAKSITLKVGGSSIKIEPSKITIKAPMINIQADAKADIKAVTTSVSGDAALILKGGVIKIN